jgi:4-carboxymuconolactone decarboxylase
MNMRRLIASAILLVFSVPGFAQQATPGLQNAGSLTIDQIQQVSPALARYAQQDLIEGLWKRPQLSRRDRSIVTLSIVIAKNQTASLGIFISNASITA